jgi:hypothetical protein
MQLDTIVLVMVGLDIGPLKSIVIFYLKALGKVRLAHIALLVRLGVLDGARRLRKRLSCGFESTRGAVDFQYGLCLGLGFVAIAGRIKPLAVASHGRG